MLDEKQRQAISSFFAERVVLERQRATLETLNDGIEQAR
jgi:hypothetical protein